MQVKGKISNYFNSMKNSSLETCDINNLVDITGIEIDDSDLKSNRLCEFIKKIQNPYLFKVGDVAVKVIYKDDGPSFQEKFEELISANIRK